MKRRFDVVIIGGGAAGLSCAVSASDSGCKSIAVIDRMSRTGKKLTVTGNGKCNLSNRNISEEFYHGSFNIKPILDEFHDIRGFFEKAGLFTYSDAMGRIYPLSNTASSVADTLRLSAEQKGVQILTDTCCTEVKKIEKGFLIKSEENEIVSKTVVLACGGCAAAVHGSDGSGFSIAKRLGIEISPPFPALCPLYCDGTKSLDGVRSKCGVSLYKGGELIKKEMGEVQFTKKGLSGICIFNLSAAFGNNDRDISVCIDFLPDYTFNSAYHDILLKAYKLRKGFSSEEIFSGIFNKKIAVYLIKRADLQITNSYPDWDYSDLKKITALAKNLEFNIIGRADFNSAQVSAGGIKGGEIDSGLMSKKIDGLFFAGEIIDTWGDCGGYNLHIAFASGIKAGKSAALFVKERESGV